MNQRGTGRTRTRAPEIPCRCKHCIKHPGGNIATEEMDRCRSSVNSHYRDSFKAATMSRS
jgi:hypothetical protein